MKKAIKVINATKKILGILAKDLKVDEEDKKLYRFIVGALALVWCLAIVESAVVRAKAENIHISPVAFEQVAVKEGDSLWSIATEIQGSQPSAPENAWQIIDVICDSNQLKTGRVYAGSYVWIPVYDRDNALTEEGRRYGSNGR